MSDVLLLVHLLAVITWLGAGLMGQVLAMTALRSGDEATFARLVAMIGALTLRLFVPASLLAMASGVALVLDGPWGFGEPWIVVALAGFAATFLVGATVLGPRAAAFGAALAEGDGTPTAAALVQARGVLAVARVELVVLVLVVADMVLKPGA